MLCVPEQLSFDTSAELDPIEIELRKIIAQVCTAQDVDIKYIHCCPVKSGGFSAWICEPVDGKETQRVFSVLCKNTKKIKRYEVSIKYKKINNVAIPADAELVLKEEKHKDENGDIYTTKKAALHFPLDSLSLFPYLHEVFDYELANFEPSEKFGCCGKYIECSHAKECLHKLKFYARACYYRKNLEAGRIFYGDNANNCSLLQKEKFLPTSREE